MYTHTLIYIILHIGHTPTCAHTHTHISFYSLELTIFK